MGVAISASVNREPITHWPYSQDRGLTVKRTQISPPHLCRATPHKIILPIETLGKHTGARGDSQSVEVAGEILDTNCCLGQIVLLLCFAWNVILSHYPHITLQMAYLCIGLLGDSCIGRVTRAVRMLLIPGVVFLVALVEAGADCGAG